MGVLAYRRVDTAAALARCVKELNRFTPRPNLVVISGDLVDSPSRKEAKGHERRGRRLIRPREAWGRLGCGHTKFYELVGAGRIHRFRRCPLLGVKRT
jgi:hypothetical protein